MKTMRPPPFSSMDGRTAWAQKNAPSSTTPTTRRQSSYVTSRNGLCGRIAALLTSTSMRPNSSSARAAIASTCALSATSASTLMAPTPSARASSATESASA